MAKTVDPSSVAWRTDYPWDTWFDGRAWVLTQGDDFQVAPKAMATIAHQNASRRSIKIRTAIDSAAGTVTLQRVD